MEWKLITDLPVRSLAAAVEKLEWYALRWKIETFHKILKSGCKVEQSKLRSAGRLVNFLSVCCILSWRIFWMTRIARTAPEASPRLALTEAEMLLFDRLLEDKHGEHPPPSSTISPASPGWEAIWPVPTIHRQATWSSTTKERGNGREFPFDWKQNEAVVVSFDSL